MQVSEDLKLLLVVAVVVVAFLTIESMLDDSIEAERKDQDE